MRSTLREPGLISRFGHGIWLNLSQVYYRMYHRLDVVHRDQMPVVPPFILVANHSSHLDASALIAALPRKLRSCTYPLAAGDTFFSTTKGSLFGALFLNALPLWRKKACRHSLAELRERLEQGNVGLVLFPEGTRTRDGTMGDFKPGIGMLVAGSNIPVIPCHIQGAFDALPPGARLPKRRRLRITVSVPLTFEDSANDREGWKAIAQELAERVKTCPQDQSG